MLNAFLGKLWPNRGHPDQRECTSVLSALLCSPISSRRLCVARPLTLLPASHLALTTRSCVAGRDNGPGPAADTVVLGGQGEGWAGRVAF